MGFIHDYIGHLCQFMITRALYKMLLPSNQLHRVKWARGSKLQGIRCGGEMGAEEILTWAHAYCSHHCGGLYS